MPGITTDSTGFTRSTSQEHVMFWCLATGRRAASATLDASWKTRSPCMNGLYGTAVRLTRNGDAARDLVQDTYLKALRAQARFKPGTNLKAWLYTILHNTWRNRQRDRARARVSFDSDTVDAAVDAGRPGVVEQTTPETAVAARDARRRPAGGARPVARGLSRGGMAARRRGLQLSGDRRRPGGADWHGDVAHLAGAQAPARLPHRRCGGRAIARRTGTAGPS